MKTFTQESRRLILITLAALFVIGGCSDSGDTSPGNLEAVYMSSTAGTDLTGTLVLESAKILIKDIKLNVANSEESTNFKTGPYVLFLNLNSSMNTIGSGYIPAGTYDKIQFEIHKPSDGELVPDPEFSDGSLKYSVIVRGTYNGSPFIYKSDKSAKQKLHLTNALIVTEFGSNVTLQVSPYLWFIDSNGQYMNPSDANNSEEIDNNLKDNIKASFKACKDNDKDGIPD